MFRGDIFKLLLNKVGDVTRADWRRTLSSSGYVRILDKNTTLFQRERDTQRPLVVLIGWLFAKPKHLHKFGDFYMNKGFDVVTVQIYLHQLLVPRKVQTMAASVLDLLSDADHPSPVLLHTFSVGAYIFGEMLNLLAQHPDRYRIAAERAAGLVLDSPVDYNGIPSGVSKAMTSNRLLSEGIEHSLDVFLKLSTSKRVHHIQTSETFKQNPLRLPAQILYSLSDPVCEPGKLESIASSWRHRGLVAETQFWTSARHVCAYKKYPHEYEHCLLNFIHTIEILAPVKRNMP